MPLANKRTARLRRRVTWHESLAQLGFLVSAWRDGRRSNHDALDPAVWHEIDLVRVRDRKAPGGWRYYAHLLTHQRGYQSAATLARRAQIPTGRRAGVDANVSNLALAGPRNARVDGVPLRAYRHDRLSGGYHHTRVNQAAATRSARQAKRARAHQVAARIVHTNGNIITVEDCTISTWARLWGKRIALFSPGMLVAALARECAATGGAAARGHPLDRALPAPAEKNSTPNCSALHDPLRLLGGRRY